MWCMAMSGGDGKGMEQPQSEEWGELWVDFLNYLLRQRILHVGSKQNPPWIGLSCIKKDTQEKTGREWCCHGWRGKSWIGITISHWKRALGFCKACPKNWFCLVSFFLNIILSSEVMERAEVQQQEECKQEWFEVLMGSTGSCLAP